MAVRPRHGLGLASGLASTMPNSGQTEVRTEVKPRLNGPDEAKAEAEAEAGPDPASAMPRPGLALEYTSTRSYMTSSRYIGYA